MSEDNLEVVSQEMMDELKLAGEVADPVDLDGIIMDLIFKIDTPFIRDWYLDRIDRVSAQLKLIKHIWLNDPQFKAEKPKKWIVRSKKIDFFTGYWFLALNKHGLMNLYFGDKYTPYKFDTREEAEKWRNPQTEVVEVEE